MSPFFCRICQVLDAEGIYGHATNRCATNKESHATNKETRFVQRKFGKAVEGQTPQEGLHADAPGGRTRNRRTREAYNAYQREYMRKRRAPRPNTSD